MAGDPAHVGRACRGKCPQHLTRQALEPRTPGARNPGRGLGAAPGRGLDRDVTAPPPPRAPSSRRAASQPSPHLEGQVCASRIRSRPRVSGEHPQEPCLGPGRRVRGRGPHSPGRGSLVKAGWSKSSSCVGRGRYWLLPKLLPCLMVTVTLSCKRRLWRDLKDRKWKRKETAGFQIFQPQIYLFFT